MPIVATIGTVIVILLGLFLVSSDDIAPDMQFFGWILVVIGAFGLLVQLVLPRSGRRR